jgi:hypothetical protein
MKVIKDFVMRGVPAPPLKKSHPKIYERRGAQEMMKDTLIVEKQRY